MKSYTTVDNVLYTLTNMLQTRLGEVLSNWLKIKGHWLGTCLTTILF